MKKTIIVINGKGGCGKDTLISYAKKHRDFLLNVSSIEPIKALAEQYGYDDKYKTDSHRRALSLLKEALNLLEEDFTTKYLLGKCKFFVAEYAGDLMFVHIREPEEMDKFINGVKRLRANGWAIDNIYTLLIKRQDTDEKTYGNKSDDEVENYEYDYTFINKDGEEKDCERFLDYLNTAILKEV